MILRVCSAVVNASLLMHFMIISSPAHYSDRRITFSSRLHSWANSRGHACLQSCLIWMFLISTTIANYSNDMQKPELLPASVGFFLTFRRQRRKQAFVFFVLYSKRSNKMSGETHQREVKRFSSKAFHFGSVVAALASVFAPLTVSPKSHQSPRSVNGGDSRRKLAGKLWRCSNLSPQQPWAAVCFHTLTGTSLIGSRETRFPDGTSKTVIKTYLLQLLRAMKGSVSV